MLSSLVITKLIEFYPVLGELPAGLQHNLLDASYPVRAEAGKILFDTGETVPSFLLLTEGSIRVTRPAKDRELILYRVRPGECCILTISHLLGYTHYQVRAQVETDVSGVVLPQALFKQLVDQSPVFSAFLFRSFADRLVELLELLEALTSLRLDQRLAGLILSKGDVIKTTHSQLADELGSVREVISRILKDFEEKGLIQLERGQIRILDKEALRNIAHIGDPGH